MAACGGDDTTGSTTGGAGSANTGTSGTNGNGGGAGTSNGTGGGSAGSNGTAGMAGSAGGAGGSGGAGGALTGGGGLGGGMGDGGMTACKPDPGYALQFRGTGDDRVHADITKLPLGKTSRTIELWVYFEDSNLSWHGEHGVFEYGLKAGDATYPGGGCHEFGLNSVDWPQANAQGVIHPYGNCGSVDNNFFLPMGTPRAGWVHFSFGYDSQANQFHFTINGSEMISNANGGITHPIGTWPAETGWNSTKSPLRIGTTDEFAGPPGWQGKIDELRVWNVYRTADQIKTNMKVLLKGTEAGLVAYYHFDEGMGMSSADATGDTANAAQLVGTDKATWPMWVKSDLTGFTCAQ